MAEKKDAPEHIKKFYELSEKVEGALATTDHHHRKAIIEGEKAIMKDGVLDLKKLRTPDGQNDYVKAVSDSYMDAAKEYFKVGKDAKGDDIWQEQLMSAYAGFTRGQFTEWVREDKDNFTYDLFDQKYKNHFMKELKNRLQPIPGSHLDDTHIDDIVEHIGGKDLIDKKKIRRQDAINLLSGYRSEKALSKGLLRQLQIPDYALKKKEYRSDYVEKAA